MAQAAPAEPADTRVVPILVVDDHAIVREGVRRALEGSGGRFRVAAEAGSVAEASTVLERERIDVALLDVVLPDGDGIQLCRHIRTSHPTIGCLILTGHTDAHLVVAASMAGAAGYLTKDSDAEAVLDAVGAVARGNRLLGPDEVGSAVDALAARQLDATGMLADLTRRERAVFELVGQGLSNREIADQLSLTEKTVKNYVSRMLAKLAMDRRTQVASLAARLGERRAASRPSARPAPRPHGPGAWTAHGR